MIASKNYAIMQLVHKKIPITYILSMCIFFSPFGHSLASSDIYAKEEKYTKTAEIMRHDFS